MATHQDDDLTFVARSIGKRIRELRRARDPIWSQERLAREADVANATVYRAEAGQRPSDWDTLDAIAKALGVSLADLLVFKGDTRVKVSGDSLVAA